MNAHPHRPKGGGEGGARETREQREREGNILRDPFVCGCSSEAKQKQTRDCGGIQTLTGVLDLEVVHGEVAEGVLAKFDLTIRG